MTGRLATAHSGNESNPKIGMANVLMAAAVVSSVMTFMPKPAPIMSETFIVEASNTIAFGAVATGNINA